MGIEPVARTQYREYTVGSLSSAIVVFYVYAAAKSQFSILIGQNIMKHARTHKFELSGPTVHPVYCVTEQGLHPRAQPSVLLEQSLPLCRNKLLYRDAKKII